MEIYCVSYNGVAYDDHLSLFLACLESSVFPCVISINLYNNPMGQVTLSPVHRGRN